MLVAPCDSNAPLVRQGGIVVCMNRNWLRRQTRKAVMPDETQGIVAHTIFTETQIYTSPDGEKYPYLFVHCQLEDGRRVQMLLNATFTVMMLDAVTRYMGTVFNVKEVGKTLDQAMDEAVDWDSLGPPPPDIVDYSDPDIEPDPDYRHDETGLDDD